MSVALAELLDLETAWRRVKHDIKERAFLTLPYEVELVETDLQAWIESIRQALRSGQYNPGPMTICEVPKGRGLVRPGSCRSSTEWFTPLLSGRVYRRSITPSSGRRERSISRTG